MKSRRYLVLAFALIGAACSDSIAPRTIDPSVASRLMPSVEDARLRLTPNLENAGVRDRVAFDLTRIKEALDRGDGQGARDHVHVLGVILYDYKRGLGSVIADGPDVSAIALVLHAVSQVVGGGFDIEAFR